MTTPKPTVGASPAPGPVGGPAAAESGDMPMARPPVALYVHFPFCVSLCPYCDFVVVTGADARGPSNRVTAVVGALLAEIRLRADAVDERHGKPGAVGRQPLGSLYIGGGTPSLLPADDLDALIGLVDARFGLAPDAEVTLEVNPGPDERGDPAEQRQAGVTRLSIGAQSQVPGELRRLGRRHRPPDVADAVVAARAAGIGSLSLDLLYDVPGQTIGSWMTSLDDALALEPDHLSLYALTLDDPDAEGLTGADGDHLPTRPGARRWRADARTVQDDDRAAAMYHHAFIRLAEDGWRGYEISNWARPGHESRHNLAYWQRLPYEAVGPGAHAFDGRTRRWNAARLDGYVAALAPSEGSAPPRLPPGGGETLDAETAAAETVILGLRTDAGLPRATVAGPAFAEIFAWARDLELVSFDPDDRVRLTTRGRLLSNELFARLV